MFSIDPHMINDNIVCVKISLPSPGAQPYGPGSSGQLDQKIILNPICVPIIIIMLKLTTKLHVDKTKIGDPVFERFPVLNWA